MNLNSGKSTASAMLLWLLVPLGYSTGLCQTPVTPIEKQAATRQSLNRALIEAIKHNDAAEVRALLNRGANPNFRFDPRDCLTHPNPQWIQDEQPHPVSPPPTALLVAVTSRLEMNRSLREGYCFYPPSDQDIVQALLDHGADPNARGALPAHNRRGYDLWTPIEGAIEAGRDKTLKLLLAHGAHLERDSLVSAAQSCHPNLALVALLLDHGGGINSRDGFGETALIINARGGSAEFVQFLLDRGANVNLKNQAGQTALIAVLDTDTRTWVTELEKRFEIVKRLLDRGADVNVRDREGDTALFYVVRFGDERSAVAVATLLIARGADVNARDRSGHTLLQLCRLPQLAQVLKASGARE